MPIYRPTTDVGVTVAMLNANEPGALSTPPMYSGSINSNCVRLGDEQLSNKTGILF